jgi:Mn-dependent DtxR family transcriptional regulator
VELHESGQMYLETIHVLLQRQDHVRAIDVGNHLGYSKPSVSRALGLLKQEGYITVNGDGHISLNPSGEELARQIYERHTVLTRMLTALGVDEETAAEDACRIEHVISDATFAAVKQHFLDVKKD